VIHHSEAFVAFDTSKLRNAVAIADAGREGEIRFLGEIDTTPAATGKLVKKLAAKYACFVVAPSLTPKNEPEARAHRAAHRLRGDAVGGAPGAGAYRASRLNFLLSRLQGVDFAGFYSEARWFTGYKWLV